MIILTEEWGSTALKIGGGILGAAALNSMYHDHWLQGGHEGVGEVPSDVPSDPEAHHAQPVKASVAGSVAAPHPTTPTPQPEPQPQSVGRPTTVINYYGNNPAPGLVRTPEGQRYPMIPQGRPGPVPGHVAGY